jgi:hypothetical protein
MSGLREVVEECVGVAGGVEEVGGGFGRNVWIELGRMEGGLGRSGGSWWGEVR